MQQSSLKWIGQSSPGSRQLWQADALIPKSEVAPDKKSIPACRETSMLSDQLKTPIRAACWTESGSALVL